MEFSKFSIIEGTRWNVFFFAQIERKHIFAQIQIFKTIQNMKKFRFIALLAALICQFSTIVRANSLELKGDTIPVVIGVLSPGDSNGGDGPRSPSQAPISVYYDSTISSLVLLGNSSLNNTPYHIYNHLGVSVCSGFVLFDNENLFSIDLSALEEDVYTLEFVIDSIIYIGVFSIQ